jgi:MFS family permease
MAEFKSTSDTLATFVVSVFVLGFAFGPLVIGPMSEIYGRRPVYNICIRYLYSSFRRCIQYGHAYARFLSGIFGVAVITCGGGSISDMLPPEKTGRAMAIWSVGPILGPVSGPGTSPSNDIISF